MKIISIIPARGGSKGVPRKNIISVANKPLIAWTIEASLKSKFISRTIVSSEDKEILAVAKSFGAQAIKRPKVLAGDKVPSEPVITHVLEYLKKKENYIPDIIVFLQPTSPLRDSDDIDKAVGLLLKNKKSTAVISVCEPEHNPLKTFRINRKGYLEGIINNKYPFMRRQDLTPYYLHNGAIYIIKTEFFNKNHRLITATTLPYIMSLKKSKQIDNPSDLIDIEKMFFVL
jgi:CMP-N,N'-diacetyllegionaminic acid synthase